MCKRLVPYCHAKNIFEVEIDFFKSHDTKYLFLDLDNTLDAHNIALPSERVIAFINSLRENNITPVIISNNNGTRVSTYANALNVSYVGRAMKPSSIRIKKYIKANNIDKNTVFMAGDQMFTDISSANGAKIKSILVDKIVEGDQLVTKFNRIFERFFRKRFAKKGKFIDWRNRYGKTN